MYNGKILDTGYKQINNFFNNRIAQKVFAVLVLLVVVFFLFQVYHKAYRPQGYDFKTYIVSARALAAGENPYETGYEYQYIYPVFFAFIFIPFAYIPYWMIHFLWYAFSMFAMIYSVLFLVRLVLPAAGVKNEEIKKIIVPLCFVFLVLVPSLQHNFVNGESNALILFLMVMFYKYYLKGSVIPASLFLSAGICIKLYPLIFILFLLFRRKYMYVLATAFFSAIMLLSPFLLLGGKVFAYYDHYLTRYISGEITGSAYVDKKNMYFSVSRFISYYFPALYDYSRAAVILTALAINFLMIGAVETAGRIPKKPNIEAWVFNIYLVSILLIAPKSQYHHMMYMVPAAALLFLKAYMDRRFFTPLSLFSSLAFIVFYYIGKVVRTGPYFVIYLLILFTALTYVIIKEKKAQEQGALGNNN